MVGAGWFCGVRSCVEMVFGTMLRVQGDVCKACSHNNAVVLFGTPILIYSPCVPTLHSARLALATLEQTVLQA